MVGGGDPFYVNFWVNRAPLERKLAKTITHLATRSLCDSWASCLYLLFWRVKIVIFVSARSDCLLVVWMHQSLYTGGLTFAEWNRWLFSLSGFANLSKKYESAGVQITSDQACCLNYELWDAEFSWERNCNLIQNFDGNSSQNERVGNGNENWNFYGGTRGMGTRNPFTQTSNSSGT